MPVFNNIHLVLSRAGIQTMLLRTSRIHTGKFSRHAEKNFSFQDRAKTTVLSFFTIFALLLLFLVIVRWYQQIIFINNSVPSNLIKSDDLQRMWFMGLRFDGRTISICLLPAFFFGIILSIRQVPYRLWMWVTTFFIFIATIIIAILAISNFYYIQTYRTYFEIFVFSFLHESPGAVLTTVWQDYPVVIGLLSCGIFSMICAWVWQKTARYLIKTIREWNFILFIFFMVIAIILIYGLIRGSVTSRYPLRRNNAQVSVIDVLNKTVPNGPMAFAWALSDFRKNKELDKAPMHELPHLLQQANLDSLYSHTPRNDWLAAHKPNVIFCLMESMGQNMMTYDHLPETDLMGSLRKHFTNDFVFRRFISEDIHTIQSFSALFFISPISNLSTSMLNQQKLPDTPFENYKKAGYKTVFITSGTKTWERMGDYLKVQGVDEIYDQADLVDRYNLTDVSEWGVPDEYAFRFANELLEKKNDKPLFVVILTVTNHPPFVVPDGYRPLPVKPTQALKERGDFGAQDEVVVMQTYQYATNALGDFIDRVIISKEGNKTIIAATGDHKMQRMRGVLPREQFNEYAVPFYLHVPAEIKEHVEFKFDPKRVGSHKDIIPTLYHFSLSDQEYLAVGGRNILAKVDDPTRAFGYNVELWADDKCIYSMQNQKACLEFDPDESLMISDTHKKTEPVQKQKMQAYTKLLQWQIHARAKGTY